MHEKEKRAFLTVGMRRVLIVVSAVVVLGLFVTIWLAARPAAQGIDDVDATPFSASPTQGPVPGATPTEGSEVLPPDEAGGIRLPSLAPEEPLFATPFPAAGSRENGLIEGFPVDAMEPVAGSDVLQSSIAVEEQTMQATLTARTDSSPDEVRAHFASAWTNVGLAEQPTPSTDELSFVGPFESLTLAFSPSSGTGTVYVVYGVFRAG